MLNIISLSVSKELLLGRLIDLIFMSNRLPRIMYYSDAIYDYFIHIEEIEFRTFDRFQIDHLASYTILMQSTHIYF